MRVFIATFLLCLSVIIQIVFVLCLFKSKKNKFCKQCAEILAIVAFISIFDVLSIYCTNGDCFINFSVLWHALLPLLLLMFLRYIKNYVRHRNIIAIDIILIVLSLIDSITLLSNLFSPWMIKIEEITYIPTSEIFYRVTDLKYLWYHVILCFVLGCISLYLTIYQLVKSPKLYKPKYFTLMVAIIFALAWNLFFQFKRNIPVDFSVLVYMVIALEFTYFTLIQTPKKLENNIQNMLLNNINDGFVVYDSNGELFYHNAAIEKIFLIDEIDTNYDTFIKNTINVPISEEYIKYQKVIRDSCHYYQVYHNRFLDNTGKVEAYYVIFYDTTIETNAALDKEFNESRDSLTGTFNRSEFKRAIKRMREQYPDEEYYIVATNFEKFRLYNEVNGTIAGDDILIKMARILYSIAMKYKIVYSRMGSDNFGICITKNLFNEIHLPELLVKKFRQYEGSYLKLKMGVCSLNNRSVYEAFDKAIQTLHYYKNNVEQRCGFYVEKIKNTLIREGELTKEFDTSIDNNYFEVYLQPQVNSRDNSVFGCEALVRWNHPELGFISPGEFIPIFEKYGLITRLDMFVWEKTIQYIKKCEENPKLKDLSISINVSKLDFFNIDVYLELLNLLDKYSVSPKKVKIEITESIFSSDQEKIVNVLNELRNTGFIIEMDDFGSGYSSLNILKEIPLDVIKLDMRFLFNSTHFSRAIDVLDSVISMSHKLRLHVIAEGVETKEQSDMLSNMNCNLMQGFYYAKPMTISNFETFIENRAIIPCINDFSFSDELNYSMYKEIDKFYGMYPMPLIVLKPQYDNNDELRDLAIIYQNNTFLESSNMPLGSIVGKNVSELKNGLSGNRLETYKTILKTKKKYDFKNVKIENSQFDVSLYPIAGTDYIVIIFRSFDKS